MKGRKPQNQRLRVLSGAPQGKIRQTPRPSRAGVRCPSFLSKAARAEWRRVAPELQRLGILTVLDVTLLAGYCETYANWRAALDAIREHGVVYKTEAGLWKRNPACNIADQALKSLRLVGDEFGLTPLARQRLDVDPQSDEADELDRFMRGDEPGAGPA